MPKLPAITPKKMIRVLNRLGFFHSHGRGSHQLFQHTNGKAVVVPIHNKDIPKGTLHGILKDLEIPKEEFINLLKKKT